MAIQGTIFSLYREPVRMEIDAPAMLRDAVEKGSLPATVVVPAEVLETFGESGELFRNRRQKDKRKGLAALLLGQGDRIPFIDATFASGGRLKQSIDALLRNAENSGEHGIYILGVRKEVFQKTWTAAASPGDGFALTSSKSVLSHLLKPLPGEERLRKRFWGDSEAYHLVRQLILRAAPIDDPVLILGESGTGKGVVAELIHELGRQGKPFVQVNCAAIPDELFESELFGYAPGAFSGALREGKAGLWELARDGTLFLDEVADLRPDHQAKILHTLQGGIIRHVGGLKDISVSARVIAATNRNLYSMVQHGKFREDLYYRLRQFVIFTPELRDDPHNLVLIAQELWHEITRSSADLPQEILEDLCRHRWPGNVRELRSVLSSLNNFFGTENLTREHLNAVFQHFGLVAGYGVREEAAADPGFVQLECLRIIRRADDAIHACEQALKPVANGRTLSAAARGSLMRIRVEMQTLLSNRLYFGTSETWQAVSRVEENLGRLLEIRPADAHAIAQFFETILAPVIGQAVAQLFAELQRMRTLPPSTPPGI